MSETFDKLLENRDYWRDEAKAAQKVAQEVENLAKRARETISEIFQR